ncbi:hypothetical protein D3C80_761500 [compost metagenome]
MKLTDYVAYFETLAIKHKAIGHDPADAKKHHFFQFDPEEINNALRSKVQLPCLFLETYESSPLINNAGGCFKPRQGAFMILDKLPVSDFKGKVHLLDGMESIGEDIIVKMMEDRTSAVLGFDLNSVQSSPVGPLWDNYYGWVYTFTILDHFDTTPRPDKWLP